MRYAFYNDPEYKRKQALRTQAHWNKGTYNFKIAPLQKRLCKNPSCQILFEIKPFEPNIYCSHSCAATVNNHRRIKKVSFCTYCKKINKRSVNKYCSVRCLQLLQYSNYIQSWKLGQSNGSIGINVRTISGYVRHYLADKYGEKCSLCSWSVRNLTTDKVPLEIDHIDGNAENNQESNLHLICPNCHSLTSSFRNLNKGRGRSWRLSKI